MYIDKAWKDDEPRNWPATTIRDPASLMQIDTARAARTCGEKCNATIDFGDLDSDALDEIISIRDFGTELNPGCTISI